MAVRGDISVKLTFYDDETRHPVTLELNRNTTANELYRKTASEYDVKVKNFQLCDDDDDPIEKCDTPLSQIFQGNEVGVLLVLMTDGTGGGRLISSCATCPSCSSDDDRGVLCGPSNHLTDDLIISEIVSKREDAWSVLCKVFNISSDIRQKIEENSENSSVRCIDVMHHVYHANTSVSWDDVKAKTKIHDPHLAKVISECDFSHLN